MARRDGRFHSEYRVEVANGSDGTLPVSEQTDGVDIDRLPPAPPGDRPDPNNRSKDAPLVEFVLGTVVGNDPFDARDEYGTVLKPVTHTKEGTPQPGLVPWDPDKDPESDQAAFLLKVRNPSDPSAPYAFMAITKGGVLHQFFPGRGSKGQQEFYGSGKQMSLGADQDGTSLRIDGEGAIALANTGAGRPTDNVGVEIGSSGGAIQISAGGAKTGVPDGTRDALLMTSSHGVRVEGKTRAKISAPTIEIDDADAIKLTANTAVSVRSGTTVQVSSSTLGVTVSGRADYTFGGPKDALPTNGPSRSTVFASNPATGGIGGTVDDYLMVFGGRKETFLVGRHDTAIGIGSYNVSTTAVPLPSAGFGDGINLTAGPIGLDQKLELASPLGLGGATLTANLGNVTMRATKGQAVVQGVAGVSVQALAAVTVTAPVVQVTVPTPFPGGVLTDGCFDGLTGRPFVSSGSVGTPTFRVGV